MLIRKNRLPRGYHSALIGGSRSTRTNSRRLPRGYMVLEDLSKQKPKSRRSFLFWLLAALAIFFGSFIVTEFAAAQGLTSLNEAEAGQLLFAMDGAENSGYQQALHLDTDIDVDINGMIAKVKYVQRFRNDSTDWQEAVYVFPLSENAAVNHMEIILGDRRILSEIKEREEAKRIYTEAKNAGKRAALTEQQRPNLFTQRIANIAPGEEIAVELHFVQRISYQHGAFEFHLPTTLTPRYIPGTNTASIEEAKQFQLANTGWAVPTDEVPDANEITPPMTSVASAASGTMLNPMRLSIRLNAGLPLSEITGLYHDLKQSKSGNSYQLALTEGQVSMDRDFRLSWHPTPSQMPEAAVFTEGVDGENYLLLMLLPPQIDAPEGTEHMPREMIFIIDTSGSMQGESIVQARQSLALALSRLQPTDRFNLIEFNSSYRALFGAPRQADTANIQIATNFVQNLNANGGTHMQPALQAALRGYAPENYLKQVVFITDGAVGNETELFKLIQDQLGDARLFTVGIGAAPNSYFMNKAAQFGRGSFTFIGDAAEVQTRMTALFRQLESPVLSDLEVVWPNMAEQYPARTPDLYAGSPLVLSAKVADLSGQVEINGNAADQTWQRSISLDAASEQASAGVSTVWGRAKIESLMDQNVLGRSEAEVKEKILEVALPLRLISKYTSLVAVEEKIVRTPEDRLKTSAIPNAVANGQVQQPGTYPKTATWMPLNFLLGTLSLGVLLILKRKK